MTTDIRSANRICYVFLQKLIMHAEADPENCFDRRTFDVSRLRRTANGWRRPEGWVLGGGIFPFPADYRDLGSVVIFPVEFWQEFRPQTFLGHFTHSIRNFVQFLAPLLYFESKVNKTENIRKSTSLVLEVGIGTLGGLHTKWLQNDADLAFNVWYTPESTYHCTASHISRRFLRAPVSTCKPIMGILYKVSREHVGHKQVKV